MTIECAAAPRYTPAMTDKPQINPFLKLALDIGPLMLFFFANSRPALFTPLLANFCRPR